MEKERIDYFEEYELLGQRYPEIYQAVFEEGDLDTYEDTERLLKKLNAMGWTFDYYLDNSPYDLRPIVKNEDDYEKLMESQKKVFEKGGEVEGYKKTQSEIKDFLETFERVGEVQSYFDKNRNGDYVGDFVVRYDIEDSFNYTVKDISINYEKEKQ